MKKLFRSFSYAIEGIMSSLRTERNMKIHFMVMILVIVMGLFFHLSLLEWLVCFLCFGLVIGSELINTAIEVTVDLVMPDKNEKAKLAKDISAGSVLVFAFISFIIGLIIFLPKFWHIF